MAFRLRLVLPWRDAHAQGEVVSRDGGVAHSGIAITKACPVGLLVVTKLS